MAKIAATLNPKAYEAWTDVGAQIAPVASLCLEQLAGMLLAVCANPTQPGFNHFLFESVAALIRHSATANPAKVADLESSLFPAFNVVLQQDVQVRMCRGPIPGLVSSV